MKFKDMEYNFIPGKNFGKISFTDTELDIISKIGKPNYMKTELYEDDDNYDKTIYYEYPDIGLSIKFNYFNNDYHGLTISSKKAYLNSINLYELQKNEIINAFKKIHEQRKLSFEPEIEIHDMIEYEESKYDFDKIGVSLWFSNNTLNDIYLTATDYAIENAITN